MTLRIASKSNFAVIAYHSTRRSALGSTDESRIVIYDLDGGTLAVSLLSVDNGVFEDWPTLVPPIFGARTLTIVSRGTLAGSTGRSPASTSVASTVPSEG